ncbi:FecR family protein [Alistipes sp.]|uniref:FecR family protein n=1 Tax=Alistipes sp. TaxID=1872444 RepID=UPI003AEF4278
MNEKTPDKNPPAEPRTAPEIERIWERMAPPAGTRQRIEARTMAKIAAHERRRLGIRTFLRYAAVFVAALFLGSFLYSIQHRLADRFPEADRPQLSVRLPMGAQSELTLPDGTRVWLNAGSELRYPADFSMKNRAVSLTGEAFFEVTRNEKSPFRVAARDFEVEVLGTRFNVKSYDDGTNPRIALLEGSVRLHTDGASALLKPNERAELLAAGQSRRFAIEHVPDLDADIAWREGRLAFESEPFRDLAVRMERRYGVEIRIDDPTLAAEKLTGEFSNEPVEQALEYLQTILSFQYEIRQNRIVIH